MKQEILAIDKDGQDYQLQAWRIGQAWRKILAINLDMDRVAEHLRLQNKIFSAPAPLADKALVEAGKKSKVKVLAEIKEPGCNRAQKGGAHAHGTRTVDSVFED
jgi:hypothetical protein